MSIKWNVGCSGFHYKEWKEAFYPKGLAQSKWFDYYATKFNTLELNVTFYRFPTLTMLKGWHKKAPEGFSFSAKVPRNITHYKKFVGTENMLQDFYGLLKEGLAEHLACVLFQLPPQLAFSEEVLENILKQVDPEFNNVIEFRNESWWLLEVRKRLKSKNITFSGVSFPGISFDAAEATTDISYYRFHGVPKLFYSEYDNRFLKKIYRQIKGFPKLQEAYIYFNNTASLAALHNANSFMDFIEKDL